MPSSDNERWVQAHEASPSRLAAYLRLPLDHGWPTRDVQEWLGHADARTTARYVHYRKRSDEAQRLAGAFAIAVPETEGTNAASEA